MPASDTRRTERIEAHVAPDVHAALKRAAELQGRSVGDFIAAAAREAAHRAIAEAQIIRLSVEDQRLIADTILDPPSPNEALRRAAAAHRRLTDVA